VTNIKLYHRTAINARMLATATATGVWFSIT